MWGRFLWTFPARRAAVRGDLQSTGGRFIGRRRARGIPGADGRRRLPAQWPCRRAWGIPCIARAGVSFRSCAAACARPVQPSAKRLSRENLRRRMCAVNTAVCKTSVPRKPAPPHVRGQSHSFERFRGRHVLRRRTCAVQTLPLPARANARPANKKAAPRPAKRPSKAIQAPNAWRQPMFPPARARADTIPRRQARAQA